MIAKMSHNELSNMWVNLSFGAVGYKKNSIASDSITYYYFSDGSFACVCVSKMFGHITIYINSAAKQRIAVFEER